MHHVARMILITTVAKGLSGPLGFSSEGESWLNDPRLNGIWESQAWRRAVYLEGARVDNHLLKKGVLHGEGFAFKGSLTSLHTGPRRG